MEMKRQNNISYFKSSVINEPTGSKILFHPVYSSFIRLSKLIYLVLGVYIVPGSIFFLNRCVLIQFV